ncbi:hypothetical protein BT69DRAFT_51917 [Atractiella rhizophila]|nr:hypothetical protein BT69DRAFT_51917 [Atractiella rhizophila]
METPTVRPQPQPPTRRRYVVPTRVIFYRPEPLQKLISLPKLDPLPGTLDFGISHKFALDVCRILANDFGGHLKKRGSDEQIGATVVTLDGSEYFYYSEGLRNYKIITHFRAWTPPPDPPAHWKDALEASWPPPIERPPLRTNVPAAGMAEAVKADGKCVVSSWPANSALQNAHLVPTWEEHWFKYHAQEERNANNVAAGIDDLSNGLAMRADVHTLMDANVYVLAPVYGQIVSYFLVWDETYVSDYHLCQIGLPTRTSVHHLYSRFAYSVIQNSRI